MVPNSTVLGLPGMPQGYSPNFRANNNQTIYTEGWAMNGILSISSSTIYPGYFLSKANANLNDVTLVLPTTTSQVISGNIWIATEGVVPDTLSNDTVQGDTNGLPTPFTTGMAVNAIPYPENGTIMQAWVSFASGDTVSPNAYLYFCNDGTLTPDSGNSKVVTTAWSAGYILQSSFATAPTTDIYQMQVVIMPRFI